MLSALALIPDASPVLDPEFTHKPLRVLICEDEPLTLTVMRKRVQQGGYEVKTATNGRDGLELFDTFRPDLVISDWMMPEMDGVEFCSRLRELPEGKNVYFILLTSRYTDDDKVSALDTGADEYLVKPINGPELMARLRAAERLLSLQNALAYKNSALCRANKRINDELQATSLIQRSLLPQTLPEVKGYGFSAHYQPSTECSGDFYDVIPLADGRVGLAIGDVSGHGAPAMVAMALCHVLLHMEAPRTADPAELLFHINNKMFEFLPTGQYATLFYAVLEPESGRLVYSSAGHNPPLLIDLDRREASYLPGCEGFPIKLVGPNMQYDNNEIILTPGQRLLLYTDGLIEAFNPENEQYGMERLSEALTPLPIDAACETVLQTVLESMDAFRRGRLMDDDLSMLVAHRLI